jgi:hypothetical protein
MYLRQTLPAVLFCACGSTPGHSVEVDASTDHTVTLTMSSFTMQPGDEVTKCQDFANPLGAEIDVREIESHMTPGAHHMLLKPGRSVDSQLADCVVGVSASDTTPAVYGAQVPDNQLTFPAGVGIRVPADQGFHVQAHYLNSTDAPITVTVEIVLHLADPGTITMEAGVVQFSNQNLTIPPGPPNTTIAKTCSVPSDMYLLSVTSHMHTHGVDFTADTNGTMLFESTTWNAPMPRFFDPPFPLSAGQNVTFACTYENDTGAPIQFGNSAVTNEMCIMSTLVYPMPTGLPGGSFACH